MSRTTLKPGALLSPLPAVLVTCGSGRRSNVLTIAWTGIVNSAPPMTYISVRRERYSHALIAEGGEFVIHLVTEELAFAADWCGVRSGRDVDKFAAMHLQTTASRVVACPTLTASPLALECRVTETHTYPSHDMFVAEIVGVSVDEDLLDDKGRLRLDRAGLIAYNHGEYFPLRQRALGGFGYSVMKPKTRRKRAARRRAEHRRRHRPRSSGQ
ncbi:MAG: flavin reductase family protein [Anaerovoracaceae bacterium]|jgi:flavin reductase (DIM6/NTAB) family NADH-FMN oxidoreductase RutF